MSSEEGSVEYEWPSNDGNSQEEEDEIEVEIQNTFYTADDNKKNNPAEALE
jgi:hypothetical protein